MEPRTLRLIDNSIKSIEVDTGKRVLKFGKGITLHTIESDEDVSHLNPKTFVIGTPDDKVLINWYRANASKQSKEMTEEDAVAFLKSRGYLAYKKGQKSNES